MINQWSDNHFLPAAVDNPDIQAFKSTFRRHHWARKFFKVYFVLYQVTRTDIRGADPGTVLDGTDGHCALG